MYMKFFFYFGFITQLEWLVNTKIKTVKKNKTKIKIKSVKTEDKNIFFKRKRKRPQVDLILTQFDI